ncbi:MAG: GntR family transcriptional regulator [Rhodothermales bacterium]
MITINRSSNTPIHEQLIEQLRYLIANGHFKVDEMLPSTRSLAEQIGVSFHTVRKVYQQLEREERVESKVGSGFRVTDRTPLSKSERFERGAVVVQDAFQKLIGLGLQHAEVENLFQEQFELLAESPHSYKLVFVAPFREMADLCAHQIAQILQQPVEASTLPGLRHHQDADYVLARFADLHSVMEVLPRVDTLGVITYLNTEAQEFITRLLPVETLGMVSRFGDAIQPLMSEVRRQTGFSGQTIATSIDEGTQHLRQFITQADLIVYTPACRRRLLPLLDEKRKHTLITPLVSRDSLEHIRKVVPL